MALSRTPAWPRTILQWSIRAQLNTESFTKAYFAGAKDGSSALLRP
jgi:hypothetical protein